MKNRCGSAFFLPLFCFRNFFALAFAMAVAPQAGAIGKDDIQRCEEVAGPLPTLKAIGRDQHLDWKLDPFKKESIYFEPGLRNWVKVRSDLGQLRISDSSGTYAESIPGVHRLLDVQWLPNPRAGQASLLPRLSVLALEHLPESGATALRVIELNPLYARRGIVEETVHSAVTLGFDPMNSDQGMFQLVSSRRGGARATALVTTALGTHPEAQGDVVIPIHGGGDTVLLGPATPDGIPFQYRSSPFATYGDAAKLNGARGFFPLRIANPKAQMRIGGGRVGICDSAQECLIVNTGDVAGRNASFVRMSLVAPYRDFSARYGQLETLRREFAVVSGDHKSWDFGPVAAKALAYVDWRDFPLRSPVPNVIEFTSLLEPHLGKTPFSVERFELSNDGAVGVLQVKPHPSQPEGKVQFFAFRFDVNNRVRPVHVLAQLHVRSEAHVVGVTVGDEYCSKSRQTPHRTIHLHAADHTLPDAYDLY